MSTVLISQQIEVSAAEAQALYQWIQHWLTQPVGHGNKLQPFELLAAVQLRQVAKKLWSRLAKPKPAAGRYKLTFTAPELVAMHEIINTFPVELYDTLSQIDRKIHNYDTLIEFNYSS